MQAIISKRKVLSGLIWRFAERCGAQGVTLIVSIVLARLLDPSDYGDIALVTVFITILNVFVDSGFANALIQKKNSDNVDFSSVFYFNIFICIILYAAMYLLAPFIASFYKSQSLTPLIRVLSITIIVSGIKNVQQAYVSKYLLFKKFFFATIIGTVIAAALGIYAAYNGLGTWALVIQQLCNVSIDTIILWFTVRWRPTKDFSFMRLKGLFMYGWKLLVSSLLMTCYNEIRSLLIGKLYSSSDLAFYNQGQKFPNVIVTNIDVSIDSVMLPTLSMAQDNASDVKAMVRRAMKTSVYIMAPLMVGLSVISETLVRLLLTEKWLDSVFYLRIFCVIFLFYPVHTSNLNAIKALGKSDTILKLQVIKVFMEFAILLFSINIGVKAIAIGALVSSVLSQIINTAPNKRLLNYSYLEQIMDIIPSIIIAVVMGGVIFPVQFINWPNLICIIIQIFLGFIVYISFSKLFKIEAYDYLINMVKNYICKSDTRE